MTQAGHTPNLSIKSLTTAHTPQLHHVSRDTVDDTKHQLYFPPVILDVNRINIHNEASCTLRMLARTGQFYYYSESHALGVSHVVVSSALLMYHEREKRGFGTKGSLVVGSLANFKAVSERLPTKIQGFSPG